MRFHFFLLPVENGEGRQGRGERTHFFFKAARVLQFVGRRQKLPTGTGRIALEMPRAAKIDSKKKPLSLSDVNDFRFGSAHLWTQLELLGTCAGGESKIAETSRRKQSKLMGLDLFQPEGS